MSVAESKKRLRIEDEHISLWGVQLEKLEALRREWLLRPDGDRRAPVVLEYLREGWQPGAAIPELVDAPTNLGITHLRKELELAREKKHLLESKLQSQEVVGSIAPAQAEAEDALTLMQKSESACKEALAELNELLGPVATAAVNAIEARSAACYHGWRASRLNEEYDLGLKDAPSRTSYRGPKPSHEGTLTARAVAEVVKVASTATKINPILLKYLPPIGSGEAKGATKGATKAA